MSMFGYTTLGFGSGGSSPTTYSTATAMGSNVTHMIFGDGAWLDGSGATNNQTAPHWVGFIQSTTTYHKIWPYAFDPDTKTLSTTGSEWIASTGTSAGAITPAQLSNDRAMVHYYYSDSGYRTYSNLWDLNAGLTNFDNELVTHTQDQMYGQGWRLGDEYGLTTSNSNPSFSGYKFHHYTGGASYTSSAKRTSGSTSYQVASTVIGGGSTARERAADSKEIMTIHNNYGSMGSATILDIGTYTWSGVDGASITHANNTNVLTLPTHTGSTMPPQPIATSWGNVVVHADTDTPNNAVIFPITWSGTTPTVGSSVTWSGGAGLPANEIQWDGIDGYAKYMSSPWNCGEKPGSPDVYNTFRIYEVAGDMVVDTIEVDFSSNTGANSVTVKQSAIYTFEGSTTATVQWFFPLNGTDLVLFHRDTETFVYLENAYY